MSGAANIRATFICTGDNRERDTQISTRGHVQFKILADNRTRKPRAPVAATAVISAAGALMAACLTSSEMWATAS